jgi:hypothetical protein
LDQRGVNRKRGKPLSEALGFWYKASNADHSPLRWATRGHLPERSSTGARSRQGSGRRGCVLLHCPDGPATLRESFGFNRTQLNRIEDQLADGLAALCAEWSNIHGRH